VPRWIIEKFEAPMESQAAAGSFDTVRLRLSTLRMTIHQFRRVVEGALPIHYTSTHSMNLSW